MPDVLDMKTGQAIFLKAWTHEAENIAQELKKNRNRALPKRRLGLLKFLKLKVLGKTKNVKNLFSKDI